MEDKFRAWDTDLKKRIAIRAKCLRQKRAWSMSSHGEVLGRLRPVLLVLGSVLTGCQHPIPLVTQTNFHGSTDVAANVAARAELHGELAVKLPAVGDAGPMVASVVQPASGPTAQRIAVIDLDGLILNASEGGLLPGGENPVAAFREKLQAAAADPRLAALVLRIHSPGGSVTACDIVAAELERFRSSSRKPVVACLMDVATSGAYYVAVGADRIVAHPTTVTGGIGVIFNHVNLEDAMAQLNVVAQPVKAGDRIDMGSVTRPLDDESKRLLQEMADSFRDRFVARVAQRRPSVSPADRAALADGRVLAANRALAMHLVDRLGYMEDALDEAGRLANASGAEVVMYHREGHPARSLYATAPAPSRLNDIVPISYPGLDRSKLPAFLYLWQPDPTLPRAAAR